MFALLFAAGVAAGGMIYLRRSPVRDVQQPGTAAWWPHLALFLVAIALLAMARIRLRRRQHRRYRHRVRVAGGAPSDVRDQPVELLLLAPLGKPAGRRIRRTLRGARRSPGGLARLVTAGVVAIPLAYSLFRAGIQVLGGLDPNFTANAWGGPSYLGAMACHYLDAALIAAASAYLTARVLVPGPGPASSPYLDGGRTRSPAAPPREPTSRDQARGTPV
ncbi:hypothetical protein BCD49_21765 [Pseudofrankia sp. EUN1h]|nr:hypothetical protein BCD49_21765 [Pseudofrankia sp. EUN1h]